MRHRRCAEKTFVAAAAQLISRDGNDTRTSAGKRNRLEGFKLIRFRVEAFDGFEVICTVKAADCDDAVAENRNADGIASHVKIGNERPRVGKRIVFLDRRCSLARRVRNRQVVSTEHKKCAVV